MDVRIRIAWRKITLRRHRSELSALRLARRLGPLALLPILVTSAFWWFTLNLPTITLGLAALALMDSFQQGTALIGGFVVLALSIYGLIVVCVAAPWFFRWYIVGVSLMFGRTARASRKEAELIVAIDAACIPR